MLLAASLRSAVQMLTDNNPNRFLISKGFLVLAVGKKRCLVVHAGGDMDGCPVTCTNCALQPLSIIKSLHVSIRVSVLTSLLRTQQQRQHLPAEDESLFQVSLPFFSRSFEPRLWDGTLQEIKRLSVVIYKHRE